MVNINNLLKGTGFLLPFARLTAHTSDHCLCFSPSSNLSHTILPSPLFSGNPCSPPHPSPLLKFSSVPSEHQIFPPCFVCSSPISTQSFSASFFFNLLKNTCQCANSIRLQFTCNLFFIITYLLSLLTYPTQCRDKPKNHSSVMPECAKHEQCAAGYSGELQGQKLSNPSIGERRETFLPMQESLGFPVKQLEKSGTQHLNRR